MELTQNKIKDIAMLARIGVTDAEIDEYQKDISSVLHYFEKLQELDTNDVEEIGHITGVTNVYRRDVVDAVDETEKEKIMDNVSDVHDGYIKVKNVL